MKKKGIKNLDLEMQLVQMEKYMDALDNASNTIKEDIKKETKSNLKKVLLVVGPLIASLILGLILKNPTLLWIGTSMTCISAVVTVGIDIIKDKKRFEQVNYEQNSNIINIKQDNDVDKILQKGIEKVKEEDYHSEKYKSIIKKEKAHVETEEEKKYRELLDRQRKKQKNYSNLKIAGNDANYLDKEATMIQIAKEIEVYNVAYKLPSLEINNSQWDLFFDITHDFFRSKEMEKDFYDSISQIVRLIFAKFILNKNKNKISIYDFVENLYYLESLKIEKKEIEILQKEILYKLPQTKIANFSDYANEKRRK